MSFLDRPLTPTEQAMVEAAHRGDTTEATRLATVIDGEDRDTQVRLLRQASLAEAALYYATVLGWPVFPLAPGRKTPATTHGFKDATTSATQVHAWWQAQPAANIGLPTGHAFDVVDVDSPRALTGALEAGLPGWDDGLLATVMTPRGWHLYVTPTGEGNRAGVLPEVDFRGRGGYVVAPPSVVEGRAYRWDAHPQAGLGVAA